MKSSEPILVVGTGAMACLFSARLLQAGLQVYMLGGWAEGIQAIRDSGIKVLEEAGERIYHPDLISSKPGDFAGARLALVLVKSWGTVKAARQLSQCLAPDGLALTLQNGLGNYEILAEGLGFKRALVGTTTAGATLVKAGVVKPAGSGSISIGDHTRGRFLIDLLRSAGFKVETVNDIQSLVWGKLAINTAINPLTAILGVPNGKLVENPQSLELLGRTARETATVAGSLGINIPYPDPAAAAEKVARDTAGNISSMLQDLRRGAPTEIDAINGQVVQNGEKAGIPTPTNQALYSLVKSLVAINKTGQKEKNQSTRSYD
jgi:2-dehydropantoate 2-reductase